jgi:hypothetical protein
MTIALPGRAVLAALVFVGALLPANADWYDSDQTLSDEEIVALTGRTITDWGNAWWKFAFDHPEFLTDTTGEFGSLGDIRGPVFLAQGSGGEPFRARVDVPRGEYMLLPVATYIWTFFDPCAEIRCARKIINENFIGGGIRDVWVKIDGKPVKDIASHLVRVDRHNPQVFLVDAGPIQDDGYGGILPALQGGYWVMLEPLSPGQHSVAFNAVAPEIDGFTGEPTGGTVRLFANLTVRVAACRPQQRHCK